MAQQGGSGSGGKLSGRLMQMRFMQRAAEKRKLESASLEPVNDSETPSTANRSAEEEASVPAAGAASGLSEQAGPSGQPQSTKGCLVLYERDPLPGALLGRMSFGGFNPALERMHSERSGAKPGALQSAQGKGVQGSGHDVSDSDMAKAFQRGQQPQQSDAASRPGKGGQPSKSGGRPEGGDSVHGGMKPLRELKKQRRS